jgi:DNA-binding transcriptional MocR family regulator
MYRFDRSPCILTIIDQAIDSEESSFLSAKIGYSAPKSTVSLAEGMPNEETFPFTEISVKLYDGTSFTLDESELAAALQYIPTQGYPPLLQVNDYYACMLCV